eukprot:jgi/Mesvir1/18663/Mv17162-RA.1
MASRLPLWLSLLLSVAVGALADDMVINAEVQYCDQKTGICRSPEEAMAEAAKTRARKVWETDEWAAWKTEDMKRIYYYNKITEDSVWEDPRSLEEIERMNREEAEKASKKKKKSSKDKKKKKKKKALDEDDESPDPEDDPSKRFEKIVESQKDTKAKEIHDEL